MTIEIEPRGLVEVPRAVPDHPDVEGAKFDVVTPPVKDVDPDPDRYVLMPIERSGEDDISLWFG